MKELAPSTPPFTLLGGPLHRLGVRLGLVRGPNTALLGLALGWLAWAILMGLALFERRTDELFSLSLAAGHARLLLAIPLFFICESSLDPRIGDFVALIARSRLAPDADRAVYAADLDRATRWTNSVLPDAISLLCAAAMTIFASKAQIVGRTMAFDAHRAVGDLPAAALWYWYACLPLFRFLMFRWVLRVALWCWFLWRLSRLDLQLAPAHPDGVGGLGFLEVVQAHFAPLALAISIVVSAAFAEEISSGETAFDVVYPALLITLLMDALLFLAPPCLFAVKIKRCQEQGLAHYSELASRYVSAFDKKWLGDAAASGEPLLGSADVQSLADLSNSVAIVRNMRLAPVSARLATTILGAAILPMAPLYLFKYPIAQLVEMVFKKLTGL